MEYVVTKSIKVQPNRRDTWGYRIDDYEDEGVKLVYYDEGKDVQEVGIFCPDMAREIGKAIIEMADHSEADMKRLLKQEK